MKQASDSSSSYTRKWIQVRQLWQKNIRPNCNNKYLTSIMNKENKNHKQITKNISLQSLDEFVQDLNKKVVMTKVKLNQLISDQKLSQTQECTIKECHCFQKENYQEMKEQQKEMQAELQSYKMRLTKVERLLEQKDAQIKRLTKEKEQLKNNLQKISHPKQTFNHMKITQTNLIPEQVRPKPYNYNKPLFIDTQAINSENQNNQVNEIQYHKTLLSNKLPDNDPVFKIPCLSPTMIQMKCIEKMEIERRKKLRQLRKDPVGTKFIVNQLDSMAAGVPSPINQSMLNDAINTNKNKFIRKPMSPVLGSLYIQPKQPDPLSEEQKNDNFEGTSSEILGNIQSSDASHQQKQKPSKEGNQHKLNLPYFMSVKKKNQHQK